MRIVIARPPMFDEIDAAFGIADEQVIFAWGEIIYNPSAIVIPQFLMVHERVHGRRQGHSITDWWRKYIEDTEFRLDEEIPAHIAECRERIGGHSNRNIRRARISQTALRLASPIYGRMITVAKARKIISKGLHRG